MHQLTGKKNKIKIYLIFLLILSTTSGKYIENQIDRSYLIKKIDIQGLSSSENSKILSQLNNLFYKNILSIKKEEIQKVMSKHNIIEEYSIKKTYPSAIGINIKPTKIIARISSNDQLLVGANGKIIENKENKENNEKLPYVFGEFNSREFLVLKKNIEQSKFMFTEFKMLFLFSSNRWDILTNSDILIKLPQDNFLESINLAYSIINSDDFQKKSIVDLRINGHLIIK